MLRILIENQTKRAIESELDWLTALKIANMDWDRDSHPEIVGLFSQLQQQCLNKQINRVLLNEVKRLANQANFANSSLMQNFQSPLMANTLNHLYSVPSPQSQTITRSISKNIYDSHERLLRIANSQSHSIPSHATELHTDLVTNHSSSLSYPISQEINAWSPSVSHSHSHTSQGLLNSFSPSSLDSPNVSSEPSSPSSTDLGEFTKEKGSSCHQCKTRRPNTELTFCCRNLEAEKAKQIRECRKKYCNRCLNKFYNETAPQKQVAAFSVNEWVCPSCRLICSCASCRRRRY